MKEFEHQTFNSNNKSQTTKVKISILWVVILFNMVFADIVGFMNPGVLEGIMKGTVGIKVTQEILLIFAILLEIPIIMVYLSRVLSNGMNRLANIIASIITIIFVIGGGSAYLSYFFFGSVEIICMLLIIMYAWNLPKSEV